MVKVVSTWGNQKAKSGGMGRVFRFFFPSLRRNVVCKFCTCVPKNSTTEKRKIWPKALPHYVLIFLCRHQEMYYYFVHLRSSCYKLPLFLLLISPSALTLSDLYFQNTSPGQKQYSNTSPHRFVVVGFLVPLPQFIFVFYNTSPAH